MARPPGAAGAAIALDASPASAAPGSSIRIDDSNSGAGGITLLTDSTFQATLQDAGGQVFDVRAFGATGGGIVDDTLHIQAAQSAAGPGCVYFPPGTYKVSGPTISTPGQAFKLESGATIILASVLSTPTPVISVTAADVSIVGPGIVDGNSSAYSGGGNGFDGVAFLTTSGSKAYDCQIDGVRVQNVAYDGIRADGVQRTKIRFNQVSNFSHSGISSTSVGSADEGPLIIGNTVLSSATGVSTSLNVQGTTTSQLVNASRILGNHVEIGSSTGIVYQVFNCQYAKVIGNTAQGPVQVFSVVGARTTSSRRTRRSPWQRCRDRVRLEFVGLLSEHGVLQRHGRRDHRGQLDGDSHLHSREQGDGCPGSGDPGGLLRPRLDRREHRDAVDVGRRDVRSH